MINFKREYIGLEQDRLLYPVSFKDKAKCNVYGRKKFITVAGKEEVSAHAFLISKDFWTFNAGQLDFTNYANGIWNDYISIVVVEKGEYTAPSINFASMGDITPENLQELSEYTTKHLSDLEKRIVEDYLFIDEGVAENIGLPNLPENHFWVRRNGVIVGVNIDYVKNDYDHFVKELEKDFNDFHDLTFEKIKETIKVWYIEYFDKVSKEFKEQADKEIKRVTAEGEKQLEILNQASAGLPNRVKAIEKNIVDFKAENETQHNELKDEIRTARTENIPAERFTDNSLSAKKLKTATDEDKIKLVNLSDEVKKAMTGGTPVSPTLEKNSVVREYIADGAVDISKIDNSIYHTEYDVKKESTWNKLIFSLNNALKLNNSNVKFSFITSFDGTKSNVLNFEFLNTFGNAVGISFEKTIEKLKNGLFKYIFSANNITNNEVYKFYLGHNRPQKTNLSGKYYDFLLEVDGKPIEFTSAETPEVMNITKVDRKVISYETLINEVYARTFSINDFSERDLILMTGHSNLNEFEKIIESFKNYSYSVKRIYIFQQKFMPAIYKIINNYTGTNYLYIYIFDKPNGGEVKEVFKLNKDNQTFLLKENSYIGVQLVDNEIGVGIPAGTGDYEYIFSIIEGTTVYSKGESVIATNTSLILTSPVSIYKIDINVLKNKYDILENKKNISKFTKDISEGTYREIYTIPSENLETLMYIDDVLNYEYDKNILVSATSNTLVSSNEIAYTPYQAIDEWKYKVKFKLLDLNTILKFRSINGEYEAGSYIINLGTKEISTGAEQEIMLLPLVEERIGGDIETVSSNAIDINFEVGNFYQIELIRSGLIMKINICDLKNDKTFSWEITNGKRLHGGLSFGVDTGSVELKLAHLSTALQKGAKAIFIGDSITEGLGMRTTDISKRYASLLRDNYFKGNALCCGMGWGTTGNVKQVLKNIKSYCNYIKYYFVMIGTNQRSTAGIATWKTQIVEIYNTIRELGGIPIIIVPPLARANSEYILQMRDFILEKGWDTIRMDIATSTGDGITFDSSLSTDGVHFNVSGNQKMYERALIDLKKIM